MDNYLLLIATIIAGCSLIALLLMYLHYRSIKQYYNKYISKYIHENDRLTRELERTLIEKDTIEKLFKTYFSEASKTPMTPPEKYHEFFYLANVMV